jgi:ATP-binding cassette subfamily B (MDR/TAP) protein 1
VGRLATRLSGDAALVKATTGEKLGLSVQNAAAIAAAMIIAFIATWRLALVLVAVAPLLILSGM